MKLFVYDGKFAAFLSRVFDFLLLQMLWVLCSLPLLTVGAATTALYSITLKMVKDEESHIIRSFFKAFRANFVKSTILWVVMILSYSWLVVMLEAGLAKGNQLSLLTGLVEAALLLLLSLITQYLFPLCAGFENSVGAYIKNAALLSLKNLPYSILLLAVTAIPLLVTIYVDQVFSIMVAFWMFISAPLLAYIKSKILLRIFSKNDE